jgi:hypothetical protein
MTIPGGDHRALGGWREQNERALAARGFQLPAGLDPSWRAEITQEAGGDVVIVAAPDGRRVRLASERGSERDAGVMAEAACRGGSPPLIVVIGAGLGQVIEATAARCPAARILLLEPIPCTLPHLLDRRDWRPLIDSRRLTILSGPDYAGAAEAWRIVDEMPERPPILVNPIVRREFPELTDAARRVVPQIVFGARANREARQRFAGPYLLNTLRNLSTIAAEGDAAALGETTRGVPAIVVAAGPSLDVDTARIRAVGDRAIVIAVDTALRPLLRAGLAPHLVVTVDPSEVNGRHLRHLPDPGRTWLVAEGSVDGRVFGQFAGRSFTFKVSHHHPWPWLEQLGLGRGNLKAWGSVLISAVDLAVRMGCNPVVFAGADLAYSGDRTYCRGTAFEAEWARRVAGGRSLPDVWHASIAARAPVEVEGIGGRPVRTTKTLLSFRDAVLSQAKDAHDREFVNATDAGILQGPGIGRATLASALGSRPALDDERIRRALGEAWDRGRHTAPAGVVAAARRDLASRLETLAVEWREFSSGTVDRPDILAAVAGERPMPVDDDTAWPAILTTLAPADGAPLAPERVAILGAALSGHPWPDWVHAPRNAGPDLTAATPRAHALIGEALQGLDALAGEITHTAPIEESTSQAGIPALLRFRWPHDLVTTVAGFERQLSDALWIAGSSRAPAARAAGWGRDQGSVELTGPLTDHDSVPGPAPASSMALAALTAEWACAARDVLAAAAGAGGPAPQRFVGAATVLLRRADSADAASGLEADIRLVSSNRDGVHRDAVRLRRPLRPERWASLAIGTVVQRQPVAPAGEAPFDLILPGCCRFPVFSADRGDGWEFEFTLQRSTLATRRWECGGDARLIAVIDPVSPTHDLVPRWSSPTVFDDRHALVTARSTGRSWLIGARGEVRPASTWPGPVIGEVPFGPLGGAVAWDNGSADPAHRFDPCLWVRDRIGADAVRVPTPFKPVRGVALPGGSIVWNCSEGGLGVWSPDGGARLCFAEHVFIGMVPSGSTLLLSTGRFVDRVMSRRQTPHFLSWDLSGPTLGEGPAYSTAGPCSSQSASGRWRAASHPLASVVRLTRDDGAVFDLTCPEPLQAAWAGPSLVVLTMGGDLLVFRDLADTLDAAPAAHAPA